MPAVLLTRGAGQPLAEQLAARFAERIRTRLLAPGARLPSVRECARQYGVSPHTVVAAYDQLQGQGLVDVRRQRGFFVRDWAAAQSARPAHAVNPGKPAVVADAGTLIRGMFHNPSAKPQPGMGVLPPNWMETPFLFAALRRIAGGPLLQTLSLQYGDPAGDAALRGSLARSLANIDVPAAPECILTTLGATHALDIVSRTLLRAGDAVMVEEPGWSIEFARLESMGMRILPVPRHADGPDLEVIERYCTATPALRPKLLSSVSVLHNPTGYSLTPGCAHRLLQLAAKYDFHIVEDDTYNHLAPERATRLCALDGLQRTIYVDGFAKLLAPNWRIGFLAASPALFARLLETKLLASLTTPALFERTLAVCIDQGQLRRHSEHIRDRLDAARTRAVRLALASGCRFASEPAGLFGWVDTGVDTDRLTQRLLDEDYLIAPGSLFYARRPPTTFMRINYATSQDAAFWKTFARVRDGLK
ncbi:MAG: PLP-dependent aminotransferase family protein [Desulfovibrionaceae bacterium]|jgi:DNA-binding transcriptional MocR family regulator|nr:PLP-dependent aminotransferase family protein [Desulfovibrionaceae bacterium]